MPFARDHAGLTEVRARTPHLIAEAQRRRLRRPLLGPDGRLLVLAADHPARGALAVREKPLAMGSRRELLDRLVVALARPGVDGFLGTPDLVEDLTLLGALEGKVVLGSMNRGGLHGAAFELDDRLTAYDAGAIAQAGLDGGKVLVRIAPEEAGTLNTLTAAADAVGALAARGLTALVEPFWSRREGGVVRNDLSPEAVIRSVAVAQGLGRTSAHTWLKLPVVAEMERVVDATTLPTLLLGGDPTGAPEETYAAWRSALALPAVRGLVVGRALLFPQDDDVAGAVDTAASLVR
ncbi:Cgl0159 family (beta/alpha)8-fold protein [Kineococcus sp. NUM-3379]